jgi:hypothetical protein
MTHTKGPWKHEMRDGDHYITSDDGELSICDTQYYPWIQCEEGDWHMLAAAPEMYEALDYAHSAMTTALISGDVNSEFMQTARAHIRAAIAKAEGRS